MINMEMLSGMSLSDDEKVTIRQNVGSIVAYVQENYCRKLHPLDVLNVKIGTTGTDKSYELVVSGAGQVQVVINGENSDSADTLDQGVYTLENILPLLADWESVCVSLNTQVEEMNNLRKAMLKSPYLCDGIPTTGIV